MRLTYFYPLLGFVVPTVIIGFGFVIPGSCIAGLNEHTLGFASAIAGAAFAYWLGIREVVRDRRGSGHGVR